MNFSEFTINKIHQGLARKEFSVQEIIQAYLKNIRVKDPRIKAFLQVSEKSALAQAQEIDKEISQGKNLSILAGVPYAVKDNILVKGLNCTAGSKILENHKAVYDATAIARLRSKGAIVLGKANLDEFAMGSSCENSAFQVTHNPNDLERVPGGSSGGPAAAVKADESIFALGSDTGGSIRQPASFCGVVGLKPTYGMVSRYGLIAFASSLDQIGPLTKTVKDAEIIFSAISGKDSKDSTTLLSSESSWNSQKDAKKSSLNFSISGLKVGIPKEYFGEGIKKSVKEIIRKVIQQVEDYGGKIQEVSLPHTKYGIPCYYLISTSEASANLARYDGLRYAAFKTKEKTLNLIDHYLKVRGEGFGPEVKRRIMLGVYTLSAGYYDDYYVRAQKIRSLIKKDFDQAFKKVDVLFTPVAPTPPFKLGEKRNNPLEMYLSDILTVPASLAGLPALAVPVGMVNSLPIGLQIIGGCCQENLLFKVGEFIEKIRKKNISSS